MQMALFNSLKSSLLSFLFLSQIFTLVSCSSSNIIQQTNEYNKSSFHYKYGDSWGTYGEFWIWTEGETTYFEGLSAEAESGKSVDIYAEVDAEIFDSISQVIHDSQIDSWDGFSKSDDNVLDGHGFSLDYEYRTESVHADGYMYEPTNYQSGHNELLAFLTNYAGSLQIIKPTADTIGYIIVCTNEFRFDLMLGIYDGIYSRVESVSISKRTDFISDNIYKFSREKAISVNEQESYAELSFEPAKQLRERSLELKMSGGWQGNNTASYVAINFESYKIAGNHSYYAILSPEEQKYFTKKIQEIIGLSEDYDFNTLFE